jgi:putative hydrolase of the HAD superfamily
MIDTRRVRAVFFDAAGTLFRVRGSVGSIYAAVMERHGAQHPGPLLADVPPGGWADYLEERFRRSFALAPPPVFQGADARDIPRLERRWWRALVAEVMLPAAPFERFEQCFDELFEMFRTERGWELDPEARAVLDRLTERGLLLGVISNFDSRLRDVLRHLGIAPYFRSVILASEAGIAKPHPELFRAAMRRHHLGEGEAIHVGDDPESDVEGALAAGMIPVLIDSTGGPLPAGANVLPGLADVADWLLGSEPRRARASRPFR